MWSLAITWITLHLVLAHFTDGYHIHASEKSCLDHLRGGKKANGFYLIHVPRGTPLTVYCDFNSEPGSAWTLVMSWALINRHLPAFKTATLAENVLVNERTPNWFAYRQSKKAMKFLKSQSSHWRATCSFNKVKFDYRDYVRGSFKDFDVTTYLGKGHCKKIEFINIRGNVGYQTYVPFWQTKNAFMLHTDSAYRECPYNAVRGAVANEDNFGFYLHFNKHFRCTSHPYSTTQYWFGGYK